MIIDTMEKVDTTAHLYTKQKMFFFSFVYQYNSIKLLRNELRQYDIARVLYVPC